MASRLEATSALLLEKYEGDMSKLREAAGKDPAQERKLVKQFKVGPVRLLLCSTIFCQAAAVCMVQEANTPPSVNALGPVAHMVGKPFVHDAAPMHFICRALETWRSTSFAARRNWPGRSSIHLRTRIRWTWLPSLDSPVALPRSWPT